MQGGMNLRALGLLVAVGALLTVAVLVAKAAPDVGWAPLAVLQWAMLAGSLLQMAAMKTWRGGALKDPAILRYGFIAGLLFAIPYAISALAVGQVGAGFVSMAFALPLMMTYAIALLIGLERFDPFRASGVLCGVVGAVVLASAKTGDGAGSLFWVVLVLGGQVVIALGNIYRTRYWPTGAAPGQLSSIMMFLGAIFLLAFNLGTSTPLGPTAWTAEATAMLVGQTIVFTIFMQLYFMLQHLAGPVYLSQIGMVAAVFGVAAAYVLFAEIPAVEFAIAAPFILAGIWFVSQTRRSKAPAT